jgi:hypothetical protein
VFKNKSLIETEIKIFEEIQKNRTPHPDLQSYEQERQILCISYAKKDENGNPVVDNGHYVIEDPQTFQNDMNDLRTKYHDAIVDFEAAQQEFENFLDQDSDVKLVKVNIKDLPEDIDANFIAAIEPMLEE